MKVDPRIFLLSIALLVGAANAAGADGVPGKPVEDLASAPAFSNASTGTLSSTLGTQIHNFSAIVRAFADSLAGAHTNAEVGPFLRAVIGNQTPTPVLVQHGVAMVGRTNTYLDRRFDVLRSLFRFPGERPATTPVSRGAGDVASTLNEWFIEGTAAGNFGDLYDNRDRGHSALPLDAFSQLARVHYSGDAVAAGLDRGLGGPLFNAVTIGNASLALTEGPLWRSLPRDALTTPGGAALLFLQYASNEIYVYPEHTDHDPELGDLISANTPYLLISQGSSGSDQPIISAVASIFAAFRPDVKRFLVANGLIAPTVQWIFRWGQDAIRIDEDYLGSAAHPSVFENDKFDLRAMIERAHDLKGDEVPPMVRLRVADESLATPGVQMFSPNASENLFDTPSAIARVIRSTAYEKRLVIDARATTDPNGRPLTFRWAVLGNNSEGIAIRPLNKEGSVAEILAPFQRPREHTQPPTISSDRVDIAVFANNGKNWSAPAFISLLYPDNEKRIYQFDGKIAEVDYDPPEYRGRYVDPLLSPLQPWRDTYSYDVSGRMLGWSRARGSDVSRFTSDGARVVEFDALGRPARAERIRYETREDPGGARAVVVEVPTGDELTYTYDGGQ